jgi:hypothetical protein
MKVREVNTTLTAALMDRFGHPERSPGLHASQIWVDIAAQLGFHRNRKGDITETQLKEFGTLGFLWERMLEKALGDLIADSNPGRYMRPGEQCMDGVYMTPDYVDLDFHANGEYQLGLEEWKVRWCSYHKADDLEKNFWEWLVQCKTYCRVLRTRHARLRALFVVGDWRGDITPKLREWEIEFGEQEIEDNWRMLRGHARRKGWL